MYDPTTHVLRLDGLAWAMEEEQGRKSNPVVQRIKVIMAVGLVVVHLHSRFLSNVTGLSLWPTPSLEGGEEEGGEYEKMGETENIPIPEYLWWKAFNLSVDQVRGREFGVVVPPGHNHYTELIFHLPINTSS